MPAWRARLAWRLRRPQPQELGRAGEALAASYLEDLGWQIVARNYRCREGEVDLVWRAAFPYPGLDWLPEMTKCEVTVSG